MTSLQDQGIFLTGQTLVLRELVVSCHIGVTEAERAETQRLLLTLEAQVRPQAPSNDDVAEVVDYGAAARQVRAACAATKAKLLETLGAEIAAALFGEPRIERLHLRIEKLDRYQDMAGIGVALEFARSVDAPATSGDRG
ncbi:MAG: dihydroneopterin aldolase [Pseudomonadota bacterium]